VDGKAFHTYTRGMSKPFDANLIDSMIRAMEMTAKDMQGFKLAYHQSDEVTFLLTDYDNLDTQGWFDYELNKVVSISASLFTFHFNRCMVNTGRPALFDSRAFTVPVSDVPNVFLWRQRDWERNSVTMLAQSHFSHKQLHGKKVPDMHEMLHGVGINWAHLDDHLKNGTFYLRDGSLYHQKADYDTIQGWIEREPDESVQLPCTRADRPLRASNQA
jgi:tRNA(His) 5'-end guanylyltransferase